MQNASSHAQQVSKLEAQLETLRYELHQEQLSHNRAHRSNSNRAEPGMSCTFPPAANFTDWQGIDVKLPLPWCRPIEEAPVVRALDEHARDKRRQPGDKVLVVPSLLVPCCAHSGTTFLWRCMSYAFHPEKACGRLASRSTDPQYAYVADDWTEKACGRRRYLLPGLTGSIQVHPSTH